jgi:hypothetical protein
MNARYKKLPVKNAKQIIVETFNWCVEKFGTPLKNGELPDLNVSYMRNSDCFAYYCSMDREITIFPYMIQSKSMLIRSVIHEYTHFLQMPHRKNYRKYTKLEEDFGYDNNPLEVEAYEAELKYYRTCYSYLNTKGIV